MIWNMPERFGSGMEEFVSDLTRWIFYRADRDCFLK